MTDLTNKDRKALLKSIDKDMQHYLLMEESIHQGRSFRNYVNFWIGKDFIFTEEQLKELETFYNNTEVNLIN